MTYPALDVTGVGSDSLQALVDDFSPTAIEDRPPLVRIFFNSAEAREAAWRAILAAEPNASVSACDIDDEDWARRSQENLTPVTVGRITVAPPWTPTPLMPASENPHITTSPHHHISMVISPSMGFGTGHHATTRLCLRALQAAAIENSIVADVGTGSGVLAIAASLLGAREVMAIDHDEDAIRAAQENLSLNPSAGDVRFVLGDLRSVSWPKADVLVANLTAALLVRSSAILLDGLRPQGTLVVSGVLLEERDEVVRAFRMPIVWEEEEEGWIGLAFRSG